MPSGSASTCQPSSPVWPTSAGSAPRPSSRSSSASWSRSVGLTSMCSRSLPGVGSAHRAEDQRRCRRRRSRPPGRSRPRRPPRGRAPGSPGRRPRRRRAPRGRGSRRRARRSGRPWAHGRARHAAATNLGPCASSVSPHLRACPSASSTGTARWPRSRATPSAGSPSPAPRYAQADVRLLSPILPSKVVCVGKNYAAHIAEMNTGDAPKEPLLFLKPSTSVIGPGDAIRIPPGSTNVHHEAELAVVIGARGARNVTAGAGAGQRLRLHDRQRRHRAGHAEERRAVDPRQGLRLLLPDRPVDRDRPRRRWAWTRPTSRSPAPSTASRASRAAPAS